MDPSLPPSSPVPVYLFGQTAVPLARFEPHFPAPFGPAPVARNALGNGSLRTPILRPQKSLKTPLRGCAGSLISPLPGARSPRVPGPLKGPRTPPTPGVSCASWTPAPAGGQGLQRRLAAAPGLAQ